MPAKQAAAAARDVRVAVNEPRARLTPGRPMGVSPSLRASLALGMSPAMRSRMDLFETPPLRREINRAQLDLPEWAKQGSPAPLHPGERTPLMPRIRSHPSLEDLQKGGVSPRTISKWMPSDAAAAGTHPRSSTSWQSMAYNVLETAPPIIIAIVLSLMVCVPFGLSFFPAEWHEIPIPRAVGIQMYLITTAVAQFVFVYKSSFNGPIAQMMIENVPFMHTISRSIIADLGAGDPRVLPSILVTYALCSLAVGFFFFMLGYFKMGNVVYLFPKHILVGAMGGIGVFVVHSALEQATGHGFALTSAGLAKLAQPDLVWLWGVAVLLAVGLWVLTKFFKSPLLPPLYFISIPVVFYVVMVFIGVSPATAHAHGWFFDQTPTVKFYMMWEQFHFGLVDWRAISRCSGTIMGLCFFSLIHVPINIPSLSLTTDHEADINGELISHGISNTLGGLLGSVQNYLCYSTSALYFKCGGGGRTSGLIIGASMMVFFVIGPNVVSYVPRCMAGCLMLHLGFALVKEALIDTYHQLDVMELIDVWIITILMTFWGMSEGIAVGGVLACITFVMQTATLPSKALIRNGRSAATLRSNVWRTTEALAVLDDHARRIHVVQLHGHLFFGNANSLYEYVEKVFETSEVDIRYVIVDFTLVVGLDSSAADRLTKIEFLCGLHDCHLVFAALPRGYRQFATRLSEIVDGPAFYNATDLNAALEWCEDDILQSYSSSFMARARLAIRNGGANAHLQYLQHLLPDQPAHVLKSMLDYFVVQRLDDNHVVWKHGDLANCVLLLLEGHLQSVIEEEGTVEDIAVGALVGEMSFLTREKRKSTLKTTARSVVYMLSRAAFDEMQQKDCPLAFLFQGLALRFASHRLQYVGNRVWETKCLPL